MEIAPSLIQRLAPPLAVAKFAGKKGKMMMAMKLMSSKIAIKYPNARPSGSKRESANIIKIPLPPKHSCLTKK